MNNSKSIRKQTLFVFVSKYSTVIISLLVNALLARLLVPEDFGIVAIISVFTVFFNIIADVGIGTAVIQIRELDNKKIDMLFTFTVYLSIVITILFSILSIPLSIFYNDNIYMSLGVLVSISLLFNTLNTIPNAILMKKEKFISVGIRTIIVSVSGGSIAVFIALSGGKYYALIAQTILSSFMLLVWNYFSTKPKFVKKFNLSCLSEVKDFSSYWFGFNIINYFARNFDNLIIGKVFGDIQLGYYDKAYKLMLYPVQNLSYVLNPILHPILAKQQNNIEYIYIKYVKILKVLSLIGVFVSAFCFVCSKEIILIFFGGQWEASVLSFKILSLSIWFQVTNSTTGSIYASINETKLLFKSGLIYIPIQLFLFVIASFSKSIEYVAIAATLGLIIKFFIDYYLLISKGFGLLYLNFLKNFLAEILIFLGLLYGMKFANILSFNNYLIKIIYNLLTSSILYFVLIILTRQLKYLKFIFIK